MNSARLSLLLSDLKVPAGGIACITRQQHASVDFCNITAFQPPHSNAMIVALASKWLVNRALEVVARHGTMNSVLVRWFMCYGAEALHPSDPAPPSALTNATLRAGGQVLWC